MANQKQIPSTLAQYRDAYEEHARLFGAANTRALVTRTVRFYRERLDLTYRQAVGAVVGVLGDMTDQARRLSTPRLGGGVADKDVDGPVPCLIKSGWFHRWGR